MRVTIFLSLLSVTPVVLALAASVSTAYRRAALEAFYLKKIRCANCRKYFIIPSQRMRDVCPHCGAVNFNYEEINYGHVDRQK